MNKLVFPTHNAGPIEIKEYNKDFIAFYQRHGLNDNDDCILINKKEWNEFVQNLMWFDITK